MNLVKLEPFVFNSLLVGGKGESCQTEKIHLPEFLFESL